MTIKLRDTEIEIGESELRFYQQESQTKKVQKRKVEKFFNILVDRFNNIF
jgi:hypothetical protein